MWKYDKTSEHIIFTNAGIYFYNYAFIVKTVAQIRSICIVSKCRVFIAHVRLYRKDMDFSCILALNDLGVITG